MQLSFLLLFFYLFRLFGILFVYFKRFILCFINLWYVRICKFISTLRGCVVILSKRFNLLNLTI